MEVRRTARRYTIVLDSTSIMYSRHRISSGVSEYSRALEKSNSAGSTLLELVRYFSRSNATTTVLQQNYGEDQLLDGWSLTVLTLGGSAGFRHVISGTSPDFESLICRAL